MLLEFVLINATLVKSIFITHGRTISYLAHITFTPANRASSFMMHYKNEKPLRV